MKIYKIAAVFSLSIILIVAVSCEGFLPEDDNELELIDTPKDCTLAITGAYGKLGEAFHYHNILTVKSDDINLIQANGSCYYNKILEVDAPEEFYRNIYKAVIMCNRLIYDRENYELSEELNGFFGEAYFLRAYAYFKLTRIFGRIPLVTDIDVKYGTKRGSFREIYELIIKDLETAVNLLPQDRFTSRIPGVTPHKGTVKVLLAEVYLTMAGYPLMDTEKYHLAAETAREVIENAESYGFGLVEDFADLWAWDSHENSESILRFYKEPDKVRSDAPFYEEDWWSFMPSTEMNFFDSYPSGYRKEISLVTRYHHKRYYTVDSTDYSQLLTINVTTEHPCSFYNKCFGKKQTFNFETNLIHSNLDYIEHLDFQYRNTFRKNLSTGENPPFSTYHHLFRYAQTLLTYAEAKARSGTPDKLAYKAVNMVRRRAAKLDISSPSEHDFFPGSMDNETFADSVVAERAWELCHEFEGRWFDIIRLNLLEEIQSVRHPDDPEYSGLDVLFQGNKYFIPLPQVDLWLNPNLENNK
ncbi:MAG: RagB/SusD family nutrient uptake outer membrane protein [Bacteroidota bacterium]